MKTFEEYNKLAQRTDGEHDDVMEDLLIATMGMVGEAAEVLEHIKKVRHQGHNLNVSKLVEESGDVLWYIAKMSRVLSRLTGTTIRLDDIAGSNIMKLEERYPELKFSAERSVNRNV